ncbi:MAG: SufD family Fe-S cluster assembly protein [Candidatus Micrarchaeia archaeon]
MMGYVFGDARFARVRPDSIDISVPGGKQASVAARILGSGTVSVSLGKRSSLSFSVIGDSCERAHMVRINFALGEGSRCAQTLNFRGRAKKSEVSVNGLCGNGSVVALNTILQGLHTKACIGLKCARNCTSHVNILSLPAKARHSVSAGVLHNGSNSVNSVLCSGIAKPACSVEFNGSLTVPESIRDIESSLHGKFIAYPGSAVSALPVLNVHSRDVRTSHGVSVTNISPETVYYMASRCIAEKEACSLIERGGVEFMINRMSNAISSVLPGHKVKVDWDGGGTRACKGGA